MRLILRLLCRQQHFAVCTCHTSFDLYEKWCTALEVCDYDSAGGLAYYAAIDSQSQPQAAAGTHVNLIQSHLNCSWHNCTERLISFRDGSGTISGETGTRSARSERPGGDVDTASMCVIRV